MTIPDFEGWSYFSAVAEHGGFRAAAAALGLSPATVTKGVARLEARIGMALFYRTSRQISLTLAGEALVEQARAMVAAGVAAQEMAMEDARTLSGPIRLTAPLSLGMTCLAVPLSDFLATHRAVDIDLILTDARADLVADGIDIALRIAAHVDSSLRSQTIAPVTLQMVAAPDYLARHGTPTHPRELASDLARELAHELTGDHGAHRVLGYGHARRDTPITLSHPTHGTHVVQPNGPLHTNNGEAMLPLLRAGLAIGQLPLFLIRDDLARGTLVQILPEWQSVPMTLRLLTPPSRLRPARVRALSAHLIAALKGHPMLG
ncbi:MAG: LysR family transcriptional regulator [Sphingomonadaceae bacterium]|nr:LysR family transcriptional regulator [Sphingomonadaceae bacterium]